MTMVSGVSVQVSVPGFRVQRFWVQKFQDLSNRFLAAAEGCPTLRFHLSSGLCLLFFNL